VVSADADVRARVELGSALSNEDFAGLDDLTAVSLHAEALRVRISTVTRRTLTFFMCH
jgi:hypothetical protein